MHPRPPKNVDFVIITAQEEEREAVLRHLPNAHRLEREDDEPHTYYEASVEAPRYRGRPYRVLVTSLGEPDPKAGAAKAQAVVNRWAPRHVLVVGAACGVRDAVRPGDVMIAQQIADYTVGKRTAEGRITRWEVHRADAKLLDAARHFPEGWQAQVKIERPEPGTPRRKVGVVLSGGDVIADKEQIRANKAVWDHLLGCELAGGGIALGLHNSARSPSLLVIRGISRLVGQPPQAPEQEQRWLEYARDVAAAYTVGLLTDGSIRPGPRAGNGLRVAAGILGLALVMLELWPGFGWLPPPSGKAPEAAARTDTGGPARVTTDPVPTEPLPHEEKEKKPPEKKVTEKKGGAGTHAGLTPTRGCQERDVRLADKSFEVQCICDGQLQRTSAPYFDRAYRAENLKAEKWKCP